MTVTAGAGFFAFIAMNTLVEINDEHLGPLDNASANQCPQSRPCLGIRTSLGEIIVYLLKRVENSGLRSCRSLHILLQTSPESLPYLSIAREKSGQGLAWHFGNDRVGNSARSDGPAITKQVETTGNVIPTLPVRDNTLVAFIAPCSYRCTASYLDETFQEDMQRLSCRPGGSIFAKEPLIALIAPDLGLCSNLPY